MVLLMYLNMISFAFFFVGFCCFHSCIFFYASLFFPGVLLWQRNITVPFSSLLFLQTSAASISRKEYRWDFFSWGKGLNDSEGGVRQKGATFKPFVQWESPCQQPVRKRCCGHLVPPCKSVKIKDARGRAKSLWLIRTVIHSPCHIVCPLSRWPVWIKHGKGGEE